MPMNFRPAIQDDLKIIISWIPDADACKRWAGPLVNFPLTPASLAEKIELKPGNTYGLEKNKTLIGFGQLIHKSNDRGHAARIIVAPGYRGRGIGRRLCLALTGQAANLKYGRVSLNVYRENLAAIRLYKSLGFRDATRSPKKTLLNDIRYMELSL